MVKMSEFTNGDWAAWSGAERFVDGTEPMIGECRVSDLPATILAHGPGVFVDIAIELEDAIEMDIPYGPLAFAFDCGKADALELAQALPRRLTIATLEAAGFYQL
jgi:hypothetical protein